MSITDEEIKELEKLLYDKDVEQSRKHLLKYTETTFKKFKPGEFHKTFYDILNRFAFRQINRLIISAPPQHGKSEGSTRRLPTFITGIRPDEKIAVVSYAATKAQKFGREIMSIMREKEFKDIFPKVEYPERGYTGAKSNTQMQRESINSDGWMKFVGVEGPLTGDPVDILILDDLYKGWKDANSPVTQQSVWEWYVSVADSRLHNDSQQLITFTRWSEQDLIAKLIDMGMVVVYDGSEDLDTVIENLDDKFLLVNFQALKEGGPNALDSRKEGEPLWKERHSKRKLEGSRAKDPDMFDCLYQGNPTNKQGLLYSNEFKTYRDLPELKIKKNYTDTADKGDDYLCSIVYGVPLGETDVHKYVIDVLYTNEGMEITEGKAAEMYNKHEVNEVRIESNNGGEGFARNVGGMTSKGIHIIPFHQSGNKEARIFSNSASVNNEIVFPNDWHIRWPEFYKHVTKFKKVFKANKHDDGPDVLTGIIETENTESETIIPEITADDLGIF
ncbi:phage terminase large subunit [Joostella sp.]|uniref:phage terminase large subunit n=1 Tax=Joostella sp. TaxID=2231138 RepID=UPI003A8E49D0